MYFVLILAGAMCLLLCAVLPNHRVYLLSGAFYGLLLGWRGLQIVPEVRIFPSELFLWAAFIMCVLKRSPAVQGDSRRYGWGISLFFISVVGVISAMYYGNLTEEGIVEAKTFVVFLPALVVFRRWIRTWEESERYEGMFTIACIIIATIGVLERFVPQVSAVAPWLFPRPIETRLNFAQGGLVRLAGFSFWGGPIVAVILVPALGLAASRTFLASRSRKKFWAVGALILTAGIFAAGYRSAWLGAIVTLGIWFALGRGSAKVSVGAFIIVLLLVVPAQFVDRFRTVLSPTESTDLSMVTRAQAVAKGIQSVVDYPLFGTGWGSFIVFNDWLFLAVALGVPGLLCFTGWYCGTFRRVLTATQSRDPVTRTVAIGYASGLAGYALCMLSGAMTQVAPLMTGFWLFFLLAQRFAELAAIQAKTMQNIRVSLPRPVPSGETALTASRGA